MKNSRSACLSGREHKYGDVGGNATAGGARHGWGANTRSGLGLPAETQRSPPCRPIPKEPGDFGAGRRCPEGGKAASGIAPFRLPCPAPKSLRPASPYLCSRPLRPPLQAFTGIELRAVSGRKRRAFTLIELLAVIAIIAILAAILFPLLSSTTEKGNKARCLSNLRQWGAGIALILSDNSGVFPSNGLTGGSLDVNKPGAWFNVIPLSLGIEPLSNLVAASQAPGPTPPFNNNIFTCPSLRAQHVVGGFDRGTTPVFSYAYNHSIDDMNRAISASVFGQILRLSQIRTPAQFVVFGEVARTNSDVMDSTYLVYRHDGGKAAHLCFADGHVSSIQQAV